MHAPVGPWQEAWQLYLEPMDLRGRLLNGDRDPLVVFDVGLGAATNAVAALSGWTPEGRDLKIISFEKDLDLLRFTIENSHEFSFLEGKEPALKCLLENGAWGDHQGRLSWELRHGEFEDCIECEPEKGELIFYEPYSPKVNPEMWSLACFKKLFSRTKQVGGGGLLSTYSRATAVRAALLLAGFYVGPGKKIGEKAETTMASSLPQSLPELFGSRWLERCQRSHVPFPETTPAEDWPGLVEALRAHPQFVAPIAHPS